MARIELSNIGGGGGTTLSLTTTGTSGAATLAGSVLNIPIYQGALTLTTTGTSGAATLVGNTLNIPNYATGGTPAGSAGQIQFNSTPAGSFAASANLAWDDTATQLNIGAPLSPTGKLNIRGGGSTGATTNFSITNTGNTELFKVLDNGSTNIGAPVSTSARVNIKGSGSTVATDGLRMTNSSDVEVFRVTNDGSFTAGPTASLTYLAASDRLGVGTASPLAKLHVVGTSLFNGNAQFTGSFPFFEIIPSAWANKFYLQSGVDEYASVGGSYTSFVVSTTTNPRGYSFLTNTNALQMVINPSGNIIMQTRSSGSPTDDGYKLQVKASGTQNGVMARGRDISSGSVALVVQNSTPSDLYKIENNGKISYWATNTAAGTTGAQTIDRPSGTVNFGIGASALVVTNALCTTASIVFATVRTNDATAYIKNVVPAGGSFTINLGAAATAETSVGFFIIN